MHWRLSLETYWRINQALKNCLMSGVKRKLELQEFFSRIIYGVEEVVFEVSWNTGENINLENYNFYTHMLNE